MVVARRFAVHQNGVVARRQLTRAGFAGSTIARCLTNGSLFRVFRGVYAVGRPRIEQKGLWMAGTLTAGENAVLGYRSAAALWGFVRVRFTVEVVRTGSSGRQRSQVDLDGTTTSIPLVVRESNHLPSSELRVVSNIRVTSVARTLLDLSMVLTVAGLRRAFIEADRLGLLDDPELAEYSYRKVPRRGTADFRRMVSRRLPEADVIKSVFEGLFLDICDDHGITHPKVNHVVGRSEIDCVWSGSRLLVELDSYEFHRGREMFEQDAARSNRLRAEGWTVLRFTWRMTTNQSQDIADQVKRVLAREHQEAPGETAH